MYSDIIKRRLAATRKELHHLAAQFETEAQIECEYDQNAHLFWVNDMAVYPEDLMYMIEHDVPANALYSFADYTGEANFQNWHKLLYVNPN